MMIFANERKRARALEMKVRNPNLCIASHHTQSITTNKLHIILQEHHRHLIPQRHPLHLLTQPPPIIRLQLRILNPFLAPVLVQAADMVLALLEEQQLIANALFDEDAAGVLGDDGLFVLGLISSYYYPISNILKVGIVVHLHEQ
jgi:hypothetical protein